eukprot:TRINITY_DN4706_c0_g1_i1.p1 TRINITY_DN4706_c0_g1~~TRINITY_DN4706_c0_g1_i1.p1  ORF type:complete len:714 (+),score=147.26 TRINITY_DN4706_c0_g1_i1:225-2366(+)
MDSSYLLVHLVAARGVGRRSSLTTAADSNDLSAPVAAKCSVCLIDKSGRRRDPRATHAGRKSSSPSWDSQLTFPVDGDTMGVDVALVDSETEDVLGHVALPLSLIVNGRMLDDWFSLAPAKKGAQLVAPASGTSATAAVTTESRAGQLHIRIQVVGTDDKLRIDSEEKLKEDTRRREREIFKIFSIEDEPYLKEFSCAFEKKILHQGRLYVTPHYIMFNAPFAKKTIPLDDIKHIERRKTVGVFNTAIAVITKDEKENVFKSFRKRGECIECVTKQMAALGQIISDSSSTDGADELSELTLPGGEELPESSPAPPLVSPKSSRSSSSLSIVSTKSSSSQSRLKRASAPATKKKRRRSDEPPPLAGENADPSQLFSSSLPQDPGFLSIAAAVAEESSSENLVVVEKKEQENSARLKQRLLIGDLVSGEEESSDELPRESSKNSSSSAYRSAHDISSPPTIRSSQEAQPTSVVVASAATPEPSKKPHPLPRSSSSLSPRSSKHDSDNDSDSAKSSSKKRKPERQRSSAEQQNSSTTSNTASSATLKPNSSSVRSKGSLTPGMHKVEWPRSPKSALTVGLRLGTAIFVVAFVASLVFPGIQWGSASSWLFSSLYIAIISAVIRLVLSKHANAVADTMILSIGGKVSPRTSVIGDSIFPALCMLLVQAMLLYSASWIFSDFYVTSWRSLVLHSAVSALSSTYVLSVSNNGSQNMASR